MGVLGDRAVRAATHDTHAEVRAPERRGECAVWRRDLQRRQAAHLSAVLTQEVRMIVGHGATGVAELIAPDPVAEIHAREDPMIGHIGEDSPDRRPVIDALREGLHDLFVGHGAPLFVEDDQDSDPGCSGAQAVLLEQRAHLFADFVDVSQ